MPHSTPLSSTWQGLCKATASATTSTTAAPKTTTTTTTGSSTTTTANPKTTTTTTTTTSISSTTKTASIATTASTTTTTTTTTPVVTPIDDCYPVWSASIPSYIGGEKVSLNGVNYVAKWWADKTNVPGSGDPWNKVGTCGKEPATTTTTTTNPITTSNPTSTTTTTTTTTVAAQTTSSGSSTVVNGAICATHGAWACNYTCICNYISTTQLGWQCTAPSTGC
ncbi:hypothetical protein BDR26DRAFT_914044 [Obelidium mucronatum]|nr:hypothetical protein BDR26DRAFT_914044 [Obelidium mucronatum]